MSEEAPESGRSKMGGILWWIASSLVLVLLVVGGTVLVLKSSDGEAKIASGKSTLDAPDVEFEASKKPTTGSKSPSNASKVPATAEPTATPTGLVVASPQRSTPSTGTNTTSSTSTNQVQPSTGLVVDNSANTPVTSVISSGLAPRIGDSALSDLAPVIVPTIVGPATTATVASPVAPIIPLLPVAPSSSGRGPTTPLPPAGFNPVQAPIPTVLSIPADAPAPVIAPAPVVLITAPVILPSSRPVVIQPVQPSQPVQSPIPTRTSGNGPAVGSDAPPSAPSGVTISAIGENGGEVSWGASSDDNGVKRYLISVYRNNSVYSQLDVSPNLRSYTFTDWSPGTDYVVSVQAVDTADQRSQEIKSKAARTVSLKDTAPVMQGDPVQVDKYPTSITMTWPKATDDYRVDHYKIYANGNYVGRTAGDETVYTLAQAQSGRTYKIQVRAVDNASNESALTNAVSMYTEDAAPGRPGSPSVRSVTTSSAVLTWSPASDDNGIDYYTVYRVSVLGILTEVGRVSAAFVTTDPVEFPLAGLNSNQTYRYVVQATDTVGQNSPRPGSSDTITFTTLTKQVDDAPPSAPGDLVATRIDASSANLVWGRASDDNGISGYNVYINGQLRAQVAATQTSFGLSGLKQGVKYTAAIEAIDTKGQVGPKATTSFTTLADSAPTQPGDLTISGVTATSARLNWGASTDDVAVSGYQVFVDGVLIGETSSSVLTFQLSNLVKNREYDASVIAVDTKNQPSEPAKLTFNTGNDTPPTVPGNVRVSTSTINSISILWDASTDDNQVVGYDIMVDGAKFATVAGTARSAVISPLRAGTEHTISVVAVDTIGQTAESGQLTASTSSDAIPVMASAPTALAIDNTSVKLNWPAGTDDKSVAGYAITVNGTTKGVIGADLREYVVSGLTAGATYKFAILAIDSIGQYSVPSPDTTLTMSTVDNPPSAPGKITVGTVTAGRAEISWLPATDDQKVDSYTIQRDGKVVATVPADQTTIVVNGLTGETTFALSVIAVDSAGQESLTAAKVNVTTPKDLPPGQAQNLQATNVSSNEATISWDPSPDDVGIKRYVLYVDGVYKSDYSPNFRSVQLFDIQPGSTHQVTIVAYDSSDQTSVPATVEFTTPLVDLPLVTQPLSAAFDGLAGPLAPSVSAEDSSSPGLVPGLLEPLVGTKDTPVPLRIPESTPAPVTE